MTKKVGDKKDRKASEKDGIVYIPPFKTPDARGVTFGGFSAARHLMTNKHKMPLFGLTLPQAMIAAADKGRGWHLATAFEWASMAHQWKRARSTDDLPIDLVAGSYQWIMGLFMRPDGSLDVLASTDASYERSPYGRGTTKRTSPNTAAIVCDGKRWRPGEFDGMSVYIAELGEAGQFFPIWSSKTNRIEFPTRDYLPPPRATFCIVRHVDIDATKGVESGGYVSAIHASPDLAPFAIPSQTATKPAAKWGADRFYFYKHSNSVMAAFRGGNFYHTANAGVFYLYVNVAPSYAGRDVGFRACKSLRSGFLENCL